ncbi:MAG: glycosyltransferase family 2 protein [Desulfobacterales bacterium]
MNSNSPIAEQISTSKAELSIIIPAYNEEGNLAKLYEELIKVLSSLNLSWEIIFSDDGSKDNTWRTIHDLHSRDPHVRGIRLSRNFGHQYALLAGLMHASGDAVISMDADLQHPPTLIPQLVEAWRRGNKIVTTIRLDSQNLSAFKKLTSRLFYKIFSLLSGVKIKSGMSDFRLLDRQVVNTILRFKEEGLFLRGIVQWIGYQNVTVTFHCGTRFNGKTKYTLKKMLRFAWHGISSFSLVPLRLAILFGIFSSGIAFLGVGYAIFSKLLTGSAVPGWASTVAIISILFGLLFLFLGILAEYLGRILIEVRMRPRFLVDEVLNTRQRKEDPLNPFIVNK